MCGWHHEREVDFAERLRAVPLDVGTRFGCADDQVRAPRQERLPTRRLRLRRDLEIRRLVVRHVIERAQQRVDGAAGYEVAYGDREPSLPARVDLLDLALDLLGEVEQLAPILQELCARAREFGA